MFVHVNVQNSDIYIFNVQYTYNMRTVVLAQQQDVLDCLWLSCLFLWRHSSEIYESHCFMEQIEKLIDTSV
jgi:hypothetical protein